MANRLLPCPRCMHPQLLVPGVKAGICPGCGKPYTVAGATLAPADGPTWQDCAAAPYIGDTWSYKGRNYTFFGGVTWHDATYDCESTELFLIDNAEDEMSLEFEEDDEGNVVWWLDEDATGKVERQMDGSVRYDGKTLRPYGAAPYTYTCVTQAGAMDEPYDPGEAKQVRWYTDWQGDLGRRLGRLGFTRELGQDTWFWMSPVAAPARRTSLQFDSARRTAWGRRNVPVVVGTVLALVAALAVSIVGGLRAQNKLVYDSGPLSVPAQRHFVSDPFELAGRQANVKASIDVKGMNAWFDTTLCLANLGTQRRYCTVVEVDIDSQWTGASWADDRFFSAIPGGTYVLEGQAEAETATPHEFRVRLVRDAPRRANFWWAFAILVAGPVVFFAMRSAGRQMKPGHLIQAIFVLIVLAFIFLSEWL